MENPIVQLLSSSFFLMFIPTANLMNNADYYKLKYNFAKFDNADAYRIHTVPEKISPTFLKEKITDNHLVIIENSLGSFVFSNVFTWDIFQILQRKYKEYRNFVFCADGTFGYFKILENGKIRRKIASEGCIQGITSYPEIRGLPCEHEYAHNMIYKMDWKAKYSADMLKNFGYTEIMMLIDYYIGLPRIANEKIQNINIYEIK